MRCTNFTIIDDREAESDEYFRVNLAAVLVDQVTVATEFDTALVQIIDNDRKCRLAQKTSIRLIYQCMARVACMFNRIHIYIYICLHLDAVVAFEFTQPSYTVHENESVAPVAVRVVNGTVHRVIVIIVTPRDFQARGIHIYSFSLDSC